MLCYSSLSVDQSKPRLPDVARFPSQNPGASTIEDRDLPTQAKVANTPVAFSFGFLRALSLLLLFCKGV